MAPTRKLTRAPERHEIIGAKLPQAGIAHWFTRTSSRLASALGSSWVFLMAVAIIVVWALTGPIFHFSSDWSLAINTITTVITFLMVFVIQNTQSRDAKAMHLKLDELIRAVPHARKEFMEAEEEDLDEIEREKAIVDQADPSPPADRRRDDGRPHSNGKTKRV